DSDGDGLSNLQEALTRTNPHDAHSSFFIPLKHSKVGVLKGDVNADGNLDPRDLTILLQLAAGQRAATAYELQVSDLNESFTIDAEDAGLLYQLIKGERLGNRISLPYTGIGMVYTVECRKSMIHPWETGFRFVGNGRAQAHVLPTWPHQQRFCRIRINRVCDLGQ
ncbi:MAG: hypothetical protein ACI9TH_004779, partial [Kiritimatiellia bacterium]